MPPPPPPETPNPQPGSPNPKQVADKSLNSSLKNIAPGDCVVAFARRQIHQLKKDIEALTPLRCAVTVP